MFNDSRRVESEHSDQNKGGVSGREGTSPQVRPLWEQPGWTGRQIAPQRLSCLLISGGLDTPGEALAAESDCVVSECSWEQQVEVPVCGPKKEGPGRVLLVSPLLCRAVPWHGEQTSLCLPRGQRQRTAREVGFNSESYHQLTFTGGYYVPGDFPVCTDCLLLTTSPAGHGAGRDREQG